MRGRSCPGLLFCHVGALKEIHFKAPFILSEEGLSLSEDTVFMEEAIALANDTIYGLAGGVFTHQLERALRVVKEVRAGITWVNAFNPTYNEAPWGGYKMSGIGRELGVHGLEEYQEIKQVNINLTPGPAGWYEH